MCFEALPSLQFFRRVREGWVSNISQMWYSFVGLTLLSLCNYLVSYYSPSLKVYLVIYKKSYSSFALVSICKRYLLPFLSFSVLFVSLHWKWVSCRQHVDGSFIFIFYVLFCNHSFSLFLFWEFSIFAFKVIIDMYVFDDILLTVFWLLIIPLFLSSSLPSSFVIW